MNNSQYPRNTRTNYDGAGRIVVMRQDSIKLGVYYFQHLWTYWYDAVGRRVVVADSTPTLAKPVTRIFFDGDNPVLTGQAWWQSAAIDDQPTVFHGLVTESFLYDGVDHPIYSATNLLGIGCSQAGHSQSLEYFYHADERGSVKAVTFGSSGLYCEAASYTYQGYGAGSTPTDGRPGFAGAPSDASGVVFMRNRAYDPNTGTFTQPDPIGLAGGINLYGYAGNNPISFTDPFGLCTPKPECNAKAMEEKLGWATSRERETVGSWLHAQCDVQCRDKPLERPALDPVALAAGGIVGLGRGLAAAGAGAATNEATAAGGQVGGSFIGNAISGFTKHGIDQVINRGVSPQVLLDAARNGVVRGPIVDQLGKESIRLTGEGGAFAINLLGQLISAWHF